MTCTSKTCTQLSLLLPQSLEKARVSRISYNLGYFGHPGNCFMASWEKKCTWVVAAAAAAVCNFSNASLWCLLPNDIFFVSASMSRYLWQLAGGDVLYDGADCSIDRMITSPRFMSITSTQWAGFCAWWQRECLCLLFSADLVLGYNETAVALPIYTTAQDLWSKKWWGRITLWHHCGAQVGRQQHGCNT